MPRTRGQRQPSPFDLNARKQRKAVKKRNKIKRVRKKACLIRTGGESDKKNCGKAGLVRLKDDSGEEEKVTHGGNPLGCCAGRKDVEVWWVVTDVVQEHRAG